MHDALKSKLNDLGLNEKWITVNIVDKVFVEKWHAKLPDTDAEHIRIQLYVEYFQNRLASRLSDSDIEVYLNLVRFEVDTTLKSWAIGCLVECEIISTSQLIELRQSKLLEKKHKIFLEREINGKTCSPAI